MYLSHTLQQGTQDLEAFLGVGICVVGAVCFVLFIWLVRGR